MAAQIKSYFTEKAIDPHEVLALTLLQGASVFACDLLRLLPPEIECEGVRVASYGAAHESSGELRWLTPIPNVKGRTVLLLDDVLDSGLTFLRVTAALKQAGARRVITAVAVDKPTERRHPVTADFIGLSAPPVYLIGYGMDENNRYRHLPYIAQVEE